MRMRILHNGQLSENTGWFDWSQNEEVIVLKLRKMQKYPSYACICRNFFVSLQQIL